MSQENEMPVPYSSTRGGMAVAGSAGAKAIKYGVLTALAITGALVLGGFGIGWALSSGAVGSLSIPGAAWAGAAIGGVVAAVSSGFIGGVSLLSGLFGGAKGAQQGAERVQSNNVQLGMAQAQLQAMAIDAQTRIAEAQARIAQSQAYAPQRARYSAPEQFNQASPSIHAGNDNVQLQGTVAQAAERQVSA